MKRFLSKLEGLERELLNKDSHIKTKEDNMTERKRKLGIRERSCGSLSPPKSRKQNARRHTMSVRSIGHQSPPKGSDCKPNPNSYLRSDKVKIRMVRYHRKMNAPKPKSHSGFGIGLASAHGSAKTFIAPINAPPHGLEIQSGMEVCTT